MKQRLTEIATQREHTEDAVRSENARKKVTLDRA
jgi:hypothetical protein